MSVGRVFAFKVRQSVIRTSIDGDVDLLSKSVRQSVIRISTDGNVGLLSMMSSRQNVRRSLSHFNKRLPSTS